MKYLGIDFGLKRIGLAISEGNIASPWKIVEVRNFPDAIEKISKIMTDEGFEKVVVGLPEGKMGENVVGFVKGLRSLGFYVETADETLSSKKALKGMITLGVSKKDRRLLDAYSAAEILQNYLDSL